MFSYPGAMFFSLAKRSAAPKQQISVKQEKQKEEKVSSVSWPRLLLDLDETLISKAMKPVENSSPSMRMGSSTPA